MDRITAVTDAEGHRITYVYDKTGNQLSMTKEEEPFISMLMIKKTV